LVEKHMDDGFDQEKNRLVKGIITEVERRGYQFDQPMLEEIGAVFNRMML